MAAEITAGLGDIALFAIPGYALTEVVPALRTTSWPRRLAYGFLLGVAIVAGTLYAASHTIGVPVRAPAVWSIVVLVTGTGVAAAALRRSGRRRPVRRRHAPAKLLPLAAAAVGGIVTLGVFADAVTDPVKDFDGRVTWCTQARYVRAAGTVDAAVLQEGRWSISHPRYPLLLPVAQVAAQEAFGADPEKHAFRAIYAAFFPVLLLLVYDGARRWTGRSGAALVALLTAVLPVFRQGEGSAVSAYSDLPLACFWGAGLVLLVFRRGRLETGLAVGLLLGAAVLTKNEGLPLAGSALLVGALAPGISWRRASAARQHRVRRLAVVSLLVLLAAGLLISWRSGIPNREDEDYPALLAETHLGTALLSRSTLFVPAIGARMADWDHWQGFWWMAPLLLCMGWRVLRRPVAWRLLAAALTPLTLGWMAYSLHRDPAYLAAVTWDRFLIQASVPFLLLIAGAATEVSRRRALDTPHERLDRAAAARGISGRGRSPRRAISPTLRRQGRPGGAGSGAA
jgi:hypothetical protein